MQAGKLLYQLYHRENGLDASIATAEEQTQGSNSFPSASLFTVFCFHGDLISNGSSTEGEREERGNLSFLLSLLTSSLSLCQPVFMVTWSLPLAPPFLSHL